MEIAKDFATSPRRIGASRRYAQKSTGPRTLADKRRVARNALKHGWCSTLRARTPSVMHEQAGRLERGATSRAECSGVRRQKLAPGEEGP